MVANERSSATKAHSRLLCCFIGSPVSDSDELDLPLCCSSSKVQRNSLWSKFCRKKKTVPVDATTENIEIRGGEVSERDVPKKIPDKFVSAKKDYYHKFHKKSNISDSKIHLRQHKPLLTSCANVAKESPKKSKCVTPRQQAVEIQTSPISTSSLAESKNTTNTKARRKRRLGESDRQMVALLIVTATLGTMLLGGRVIAIFCTSAWFYLSPYMKDMEKVKVALNSRVQRRQIIKSRAKLIHET